MRATPSLAQPGADPAGERLGAERVQLGERRQQVRRLRAVRQGRCVLVRAARGAPRRGRLPPAPGRLQRVRVRPTPRAGSGGRARSSSTPARPGPARRPAGRRPAYVVSSAVTAPGSPPCSQAASARAAAAGPVRCSSPQLVGQLPGRAITSSAAPGWPRRTRTRARMTSAGLRSDSGASAANSRRPDRLVPVRRWPASAMPSSTCMYVRNIRVLGAVGQLHASARYRSASAKPQVLQQVPDHVDVRPAGVLDLARRPARPAGSPPASAVRAGSRRRHCAQCRRCSGRATRVAASPTSRASRDGPLAPLDRLGVRARPACAAGTGCCSAIASSRASPASSRTATASAPARSAAGRCPHHHSIRDSHRRLAPSARGSPSVRRRSTASCWAASAGRVVAVGVALDGVPVQQVGLLGGRVRRPVRPGPAAGARRPPGGSRPRVASRGRPGRVPDDRVRVAGLAPRGARSGRQVGPVAGRAARRAPAGSARPGGRPASSPRWRGGSARAGRSPGPAPP